MKICDLKSKERDYPTNKKLKGRHYHCGTGMPRLHWCNFYHMANSHWQMKITRKTSTRGYWTVKPTNN